MKTLKVLLLLFSLVGGTARAQEFLLGGSADAAPTLAAKPSAHRTPRAPAPSEQASAQEGLHFPNIFGLLKSFAGHSCEHAATHGNDLLCMACNAFLEAGTQSEEGQVQVDRTVMTRKSRGWGKSPCDIIYQRKQFSWTWKTPKRHRRLPTDRKQLVKAVAAAQKALKLKGNGATHYVANYIRRPKWAKSSQCHYSKQVGVHLFYSCTAELESDELETRTQLAEEEPSDVSPQQSQPHNVQTAELIGSDSAS